MFAISFVAPNPYRSLSLGLSLAAAGFFARLTVTGMFEVDKKQRLEDLNKSLVMKEIAHLAPPSQADH